MSLVGNLEDLSLGDILQIISLSQKSGVLALNTTGSAGRILFLDGKVRGAALKDGPQDLRGILVKGGFLAGESFDAFRDEAEREGLSLRELIASRSDLSEERIDSLCRETIEAAVVRMFSWTKGDFSFDVRAEPEPEDPEALVDSGINAQYLAMEGARISDEDDGASDGVGDGGGAEDEEMDAAALFADSRDAEESDDAAFDGMSAHEMFGVSADEPEPAGATSAPNSDAVDHLAMATLDRVPAEDAEGADEVAPMIVEAEPVDAEPLAEILELADDAGLEFLDAEPAEPVEATQDDDWLDFEAVEAVPASTPSEAKDASAAAASATPAPTEEPERALIVLDPSLPALEWVKDSLSDTFARVHIFQHTQQAVSRIRQYLVRSEPPVVLISPDIEVDRMAGIKDPGDFVTRLKSQSPRLVAIWLREQGNDVQARLGPADGTVTRPERNQLRRAADPAERDEAQIAFARQVHLELDAALTQAKTPPPFTERRKDISPNTLRQLRDATRALTEASSRGEVLPLVIRFASEIFGRVAMFMVRDGTAVGMAQHGLAAHGGPDDAGLRTVQLEVDSSDWMRAVLERGKPIQGGPTNDGDRALAKALGDSVPDQAYLAPIESTGQVIALLYADNLPSADPITDTSALEVVLHHAGLALDRAALERALHEDTVGAS